MFFNSSRYALFFSSLLLLSSMGLAIPSTACPPAPLMSEKKTPSIDKAAFLIVPGKSVGKITKQTDRQGLVEIFGKSNVEDFTEHGPEGIGESPATRVKIGGKESLRVIWQNDTRKKIGSIAVYDSQWHLADGLAVDMTVAALEQKFGQFSFYGFGWDYGGTVISENNAKLDQYRKQSKINFILGLPHERCQQFPADCRAVSGDSTFETDNPHLNSLKPRIEVLYVRL
jgi:hypothetical protein